MDGPVAIPGSLHHPGFSEAESLFYESYGPDYEVAPGWLILEDTPASPLSEEEIPDDIVLGEDEDLSWAKYDPPEALTTLPDYASDTIANLVQMSVENVRQHVAEEEKRRREEKEAKMAAEAEEQRLAKERETEAAETDTPDDTIANPETGTNPEPSHHPPTNEKAPEGETLHTYDPKVHLKRSRRSRFGIVHIIRRQMDERGESSTRHDHGHGSTVAPLVPFLRRRMKALKDGETGPSIKLTTISQPVVECVSCLEDFSVEIVVKTACHSYCKECFERLVATALENEAQWPPKCCLNNIPAETVTKNIPHSLCKKYREKADEFGLKPDKRVYCSQPNCGVFIRSDRYDQANKTAKCPKNHVTCLRCRQPAHGAGACPEDRDQQLADDLAQEEGWRRCAQCSLLIEHRDACQHMTCRCGYEFCYVCTGRWRTCRCTMQQLLDYKGSAQARAEARRQAEAERDRELREALRMIEEFEREEARKALLLRLERERQAEERRVRAWQENLRREAERLAEIDLRYSELASTLDKLNVLQTVKLRLQQDLSRKELEEQEEREKEEQKAAHEAKREELRAAAKAAVTERELTWDRDYRTRVAEENALEERYKEQLRQYWSSKQGAEEQIQAALRAYMKKNDGRLDEWQRWRDQDLEQVRYAADDEQAIKEELMMAAQTSLDELARGQRTELEKRLTAEMKWLELVLPERTRLLQEFEAVEREARGPEPGPDPEDWPSDPFLDAEAGPSRRRQAGERNLPVREEWIS